MLWRAERNERAYVYAKGAVCKRERERERDQSESKAILLNEKGIFCIWYLKRRVPTKVSRQKFTSHLYQDTLKRYVKKERIFFLDLNVDLKRFCVRWTLQKYTGHVEQVEGRFMLVFFLFSRSGKTKWDQ